MSHFVEIGVEVRDIEALKAACTELGLKVVANSEARGYKPTYGRGQAAKLAADYVIVLPGPYDVAVIREESGVYGLQADTYNGHVEKVLGPGMGRLKQLYAAAKVTLDARKKGLRVTSSKKNGKLVLSIAGGSL